MIVDLDDIESVKIGRRMRGWKLTVPVLARTTGQGLGRAQWFQRRAAQAPNLGKQRSPRDICRHPRLLAQCGRRAGVCEESHALTPGAIPCT